MQPPSDGVQPPEPQAPLPSEAEVLRAERHLTYSRLSSNHTQQLLGRFGTFVKSISHLSVTALRGMNKSFFEHNLDVAFAPPIHPIKFRGRRAISLNLCENI